MARKATTHLRLLCKEAIALASGISAAAATPGSSGGSAEATTLGGCLEVQNAGLVLVRFQLNVRVHGRILRRAQWTCGQERGTVRLPFLGLADERSQRCDASQSDHGRLAQSTVSVCLQPVEREIFLQHIS